LKGEIEKKNNLTKRLKKKLKRMTTKLEKIIYYKFELMMKLKINKNFTKMPRKNWMVKLRRKITLTKWQKNLKEWEPNFFKNIIYYEFGLKNEIENQKSYKKTNEKKLEIKWIRTKLKKIIYEKLGLSDEIENK